MKALVIRHPFAHFVADGKKTLEIKPIRAKHRGPLLIIAGQALHEGSCIIEGTEMECLETVKMLWRLDETLSMGKAIAIVDMVGCRLMIPEDAAAAMHTFKPDHYVWEFTNARRIKPFHVCGQLGIMNVEVEESEIEFITSPQLSTP